MEEVQKGLKDAFPDSIEEKLRNYLKSAAGCGQLDIISFLIDKRAGMYYPLGLF